MYFSTDDVGAIMKNSIITNYVLLELTKQLILKDKISVARGRDIERKKCLPFSFGRSAHFFFLYPVLGWMSLVVWKVSFRICYTISYSTHIDVDFGNTIPFLLFFSYNTYSNVSRETFCIFSVKFKKNTC